MDPMDCLVQSCERFKVYPTHLIHPEMTARNLKAYAKRIQDEKCHLFCDHQQFVSRQSDRTSAVDFIDIDEGRDPFMGRVSDLVEFKRMIGLALDYGNGDPSCRIICFHARHSRAPLSVSEDLFKFILSYHQVVPSFLDFVFPFGFQIGARDTYFSGLRNESRLSASDRGVSIRELQRSGRDLRLSYNLRSVESSESNPELRWSIRQCAVYHSFDIETGQALWITVKGNELIRERIQEENILPPLSRAASLTEKFCSTLDIHLMFCDWSNENWRWYINDLENRVRDLAAGAIAIPVDKPRTPPPQPLILRSPTSPISPISPRDRSETFSTLVPSRRSTVAAHSDTKLSTEGSCHGQEAWTKMVFSEAKSLGKRITRVKTKVAREESALQSLSSTQEPHGDQADARTPPQRPPTFPNEQNEGAHDGFKFEDLQRAEYLEEKLQDASLHLQLNIGVLGELRHLYQDFSIHKDFPDEIKITSKSRQMHFDKCVLGMVKDMTMLQSRIETLLQLLTNRKHLLNCILEHKSTKANEAFAIKAHDSARFMEAMTVEMHGIAVKTERETVSMRAITSVTLFFLPATFLASFMSTDIIDFKDGKQDLQLTGLRVYLAIALPATLLTFVAWYFISWRAKGHMNVDNSEIVRSSGV